jgi:hypothetical protein
MRIIFSLFVLLLTCLHAQASPCYEMAPDGSYYQCSYGTLQLVLPAHSATQEPYVGEHVEITASLGGPGPYSNIEVGWGSPLGGDFQILSPLIYEPKTSQYILIGFFTSPGEYDFLGSYTDGYGNLSYIAAPNQDECCSTYAINVVAAPAPELSTWVLFLTGFLGLALARHAVDRARSVVALPERIV